MKEESGDVVWWNLLLIRCCEDGWNENKDLEYCIKLVDKAVAGTERTDSKKRHSTEGKNAIKQHCMF